MFSGRPSVPLSVRPSIRDSHDSFMFPQYLRYLSTDFRQTFVTGASWDTDDLITFLGQKVKVQGHTIAEEAHSTLCYRRVQLFLVHFCLIVDCFWKYCTLVQARSPNVNFWKWLEQHFLHYRLHAFLSLARHQRYLRYRVFRFVSNVVEVACTTVVLCFMCSWWTDWGGLKLNTLETQTSSQSDHMRTSHWSGCCTPFRATLTWGCVHAFWQLSSLLIISFVSVATFVLWQCRWIGNNLTWEYYLAYWLRRIIIFIVIAVIIFVKASCVCEHNVCCCFATLCHCYLKYHSVFDSKGCIFNRAGK